MLDDRLGRRRREARRVPHHQERDRQRLPDHARAGAHARLVVRQPEACGAQPRLQSWRQLEQRAVPAHAERVAAAGREGAGLRRADRRHRPRHRHHRRRQLLDRPAALQRAVRRAALLRDQGGQDRGHAQGRRLPDAHARLLECDGHDRRPQELRDGRQLLRRKGTAGPGQCREPRLRAEPLPQHQRHQYGEKGMSAPRSLFDAGSVLSPGDMMSRSEAQAFLERIIKLSKADTIGAQLNGGYTGNIRFAANRISTSGGVGNSQLVVQSGYGAKHAVVTTADFSDTGIERAVRQSEAIAKLAPEDPENMPLLPPQQYQDVNAYFDSTANLTPAERAAAAHTAIDAANASGDLAAAGFIVAGGAYNAIASNTGMYAY